MVNTLIYLNISKRYCLTTVLFERMRRTPSEKSIHTFLTHIFILLFYHLFLFPHFLSLFLSPLESASILAIDRRKKWDQKKREAKDFFDRREERGKRCKNVKKHLFQSAKERENSYHKSYLLLLFCGF